MSKRVIVVEDCGECDKSTFIPEPNIYFDRNKCMLIGWICPEYGIPKWCPLPMLPEPKEPNYVDYDAGYVDGWNDCLDEIMRGANDGD